MAEDLNFGATLRKFAPGQEISPRYTLVRILGQGGMGIVWLARDGELGRDIAMKFLPEMVTRDPEAMVDLKRETKRSLELTHPNIVRIYDFVQGENWAGISMEYVEGETLCALKVNQPDGCFDAEEIAGSLQNLFAAIAYAHEDARVVHRDLKPANLMLTTTGRLKVGDFGLASSLSESLSRISMKPSGGTLSYMSPQQAMGEEPSIADDIYALGATIYDLLTGKPPFYSGDVMTQLREKTPVSMAERRNRLELRGKNPIPGHWEETIAACLEKYPANRPQSAGEVAYRLGLAESYSARQPEEPPEPEVIRVERQVQPEPKRGRTALAGALIFLLACGALAGWWFGIEQPKREAEKQAQRVADAQQQKELDAAKTKADEAERERMAAEAENKKLEVDAKAKEAARLAEEKRKTDEAAQTAAKATAAEKQKPVDVAKAKEAIVPAAQQPQADATKQASEQKKNMEKATKEQPWENSLGMRFVPVPGIKVLFSIWDTRVEDFTAFVTATNYDATGGMNSLDKGAWGLHGATWKEPGFAQSATHPVVGLSWVDAKAFCNWLTAKEKKDGKIGPDQEYRLPTDAEWSVAVGLPEESGNTPAEKSGRLQGLYPWGTQWPPPNDAGNYYGGENIGRVAKGLQPIGGFNDGYEYASPVGSFKANRYGLYDMGGNVWQWCEDWYRSRENGYGGIGHVLRGASWVTYDSGHLLSSSRFNGNPVSRDSGFGFRCVFVVDGTLEGTVSSFNTPDDEKRGKPVITSAGITTSAGIITKFDLDSITVKTADAVSTYWITGATKIEFKGHPAHLSDIKPGMAVVVTPAANAQHDAYLIDTDDPPKKGSQ